MAALCPKCDARISFLSKRKKPFPCPSCGTQIKVYVPENSHLGLFVIWMIFGTLLDALGAIGILLDYLFGISLLASAFHSDAEIRYADEKEAERARQELANYSSGIKNTLAEKFHFAEAGDAASQYKVGKVLLEGIDVNQNERQALIWFLKAAMQGYADAQSTLGRMYFMGEGTGRDNKESFFWYSIAAKHGKPQAWADSVARYLTPDQISAVEKRVAEWKPTTSPPLLREGFDG